MVQAAVLKSMRNLRVKHLTPGRLQQAFPLLQACDPTLSLETWTAFAAPLLSPTPKAEQPGRGEPPEHGILSVENEQGYIAALFTYRCHPDLRLGRVLLAENFMAFDLLDPAACAHALVAALEQLSGQLRCSEVRSHISHGRTPDNRNGGLMAAVLAERGHGPCGRLFCKEVAQQTCRES